MVMEFCEGSHSLGGLCPIEQEDVACILFKQLMEAVFFLHFNRIVHRDIKPDNILVVGDLNHLRLCKCKLIDFNTAVIFAKNRCDNS